MKLLVAGDSFAAEWPGNSGWVKLLAQEHPVTNVAQAGVSEYKILKQVQNENLPLILGSDIIFYDSLQISGGRPKHT